MLPAGGNKLSYFWGAVSLFIVDGHCDTLGDVVRGKRRLGEKSADGHVDLPRLKEAGVKIQFFSICIETDYYYRSPLSRALEYVECFLREVEENRASVQLITGPGELEEVIEGSRIGALLHVEGGEALEGQLWPLRVLFRLGVRSLGLTWNFRNALADSVYDLSPAGGLSRLGRDVIRELNHLGMLVDLAHVGEKAFFQAVELSCSPPIVSHAGCRALCDHPRNLTDGQMRALARARGVLGIAFVPGFLGPGATIDTVVDHICHAADVMGAEHVGLGSDFDGIKETPAGLDKVTDIAALAERLAKRGFGSSDIAAIMGGNYLRVLKQVLKP